MISHYAIDVMMMENSLTLGDIRALRDGEQLRIFNINRNWLDSGAFNDDDANLAPISIKKAFNFVRGSVDTYSHAFDYKGAIYWWWQTHEDYPLEFEWQISYRQGRWFPLIDGKLPADLMRDEGIIPPEILDARDFPDSTPCGWRGESAEVYKILRLIRETALSEPQTQLLRQNHRQRIQQTKRIMNPEDFRFEFYRLSPDMLRYRSKGLWDVGQKILEELISWTTETTLKKKPQDGPRSFTADEFLHFAEQRHLTAQHFQHRVSPPVTRVFAFTDGWRAPWIRESSGTIYTKKREMYWAALSITDEIRATEIPEEVMLFKHADKENGRIPPTRTRLRVLVDGKYVPIRRMADLKATDKIGIIDGPAAIAYDVTSSFDRQFNQL